MIKQTSNTRLWQENCVTSLAFSQKNDYCVVATKKDHTARIYKIAAFTNPDSWKLLQQLKQHTQTISEIDWAVDNKIITASHDRSVVVWQQISNERWQKMLVNIDVKLSILTAKWAPSAKKFALGSSCNTLALGLYNKDLKCWVVSTRLNFTKSPITTLSFHPSTNILAIGSADFSLKIATSNFRKSKDEFIMKSNVQDYDYNGPFKNIDTLFDVIYSIENLGGWINYVSFENNGTSLLVIPHTNHVKVYDITESQNIVAAQQDIRWNGLPFLSGYINKNKELILGGFDKKVARFIKKGAFTFESFLTVNEKTNSTKAKKGLVANFTKNIEKKESLYNQAPSQADHLNSIKVLEANGSPVSYDSNGVVHFWIS